MASVVILGNSYPSYESVTDADLFLAADVKRATAWAVRTTDQKGQGLAGATRLLMQISWCGGTVPDIDAPPLAVADATAMLAADGLLKPSLFSSPSGNSNIKVAKAGSVQVEYFRPVDTAAPLPDDIWALLTSAGLVGCPPDPSPDDGPYASGLYDGCGPRPGSCCDGWGYYGDPSRRF